MVVVSVVAASFGRHAGAGRAAAAAVSLEGRDEPPRRAAETDPEEEMAARASAGSAATMTAEDGVPVPEPERLRRWWRRRTRPNTGLSCTRPTPLQLLHRISSPPPPPRKASSQLTMPAPPVAGGARGRAAGAHGGAPANRAEETPRRGAAEIAVVRLRRWKARSTTAAAAVFRFRNGQRAAHLLERFTKTFPINPNSASY